MATHITRRSALPAAPHVASPEAPPSPAIPLGVSATAGALPLKGAALLRAYLRWMISRPPTLPRQRKDQRAPTQAKTLTAERIEAGVARCERNPSWWLAAARIRRDDAAEAYRRRDYARQDEDIRVAMAYERRAAEAERIKS